VLGGEQVRTVLSMLPIVSTMIMPGRMAEGSVPWWQVVVAVLATLAAAVVFVRFGSRLYERTLLRTGGRLTYREALRVAEES
jgi:ABC-2 type transport system permease protein